MGENQVRRTKVVGAMRSVRLSVGVYTRFSPFRQAQSRASRGMVIAILNEVAECCMRRFRAIYVQGTWEMFVDSDTALARIQHPPIADIIAIYSR